MSDFKPGDIVSHPEYGRGLVVNHELAGRVAVQFADDWWSLGSLDNLTLLAAYDPATQVVIDVTDDAATQTLHRNADQFLPGFRQYLRSLLIPPCPEEPTDPAVRVHGEGGYVWAQIAGYWVSQDGARRQWDELVEQFGPVEVIHP